MAEDVGRRQGARAYVAVFVAPAARAAETAAWFLRGTGAQLPTHAVVPGLGGHDASGGSPEGMAAGVRALLVQMPDGRALAISHTPFVERAAFGLVGLVVAPMRELEGILITTASDDSSDPIDRITITELRRDVG